MEARTSAVRESGRRMWIVAGFFSLALLAAATPARADKFAGDFLELGLGARALGMGGSFSTLASDATGGYWNPAALARADRRELLLSHSEQFGDLENYDAGAYVHPMGRTGGERSALGFTFLRLAIPDIPITTDLVFTDLNGNGVFDPGETVEYDPDAIRYRTFSYNTLYLSYGRELNEASSFGASAKVILDKFDENSAVGIGLDLGFLQSFGGGWTGAAVLRDASSTVIIWDTDEKESITPSLRLGLSWQGDVEPLSGSLTLAGEAINHFESRDEGSDLSAGAWSSDLHVGAEYSYRKTLSLRAGNRSGVWSAGAGFRLGRLTVDYAFLEDDGLDNTHRVSGSVGF